ncbi:maleylpyruvate isomerase family mycothiol-dependent enzyme [Rhodococcus sp. JS3073]|uniref:maleylpyruvate isomerase family mycothiol-dependent enzyme n=1 Tax=Rhodococcus sp. JS3073 TaxID=3002901 RepID=UPI00228675D8|nr:maleylpyruvate isomerase family mycothiol-dependent enzyme [Rhodococcus sp. JS3073]WAM11888.1 maleylpyruvate isomerase family mycothiol-dependent enzyme [Rhodococcus sp. JS3073]
MGFHDLDVSERLLIARRGTAYFAQRLAEVSDSDLDGETLLSGWSRRHLVAHVGYNAAALCRLLDWAASGVQTPMYASAEQRGREIAEGATLSAAALRNLFDHTVARLDEKWRTLPASAWDAQVRTAQGRTVPASETAWMRTREVWIHAVDLGNGGRFGDFPDIVLESLLTDIVGMWQKKDLGAGLILTVDGGEPVAVQTDSPPTEKVSGHLAAVVRWAAGRGTVGVGIEGDLQEPPHWL